jgi:hypothetical protein
MPITFCSVGIEGTYRVVTGVKGASRLSERYFDAYTLALDYAVRWSSSNGQGDYYAKVYNDRGEEQMPAALN